MTFFVLVVYFYTRQNHGSLILYRRLILVYCPTLNDPRTQIYSIPFLLIFFRSKETRPWKFRNLLQAFFFFMEKFLLMVKGQFRGIHAID